MWPASLASLALLACCSPTGGGAQEGSAERAGSTPAGPAAGALPEEVDAARAWKHLETQVGFGPRPAGSAANERTRSWIEAELQKLGLSPVREAFTAQTPKGPIEMANVYADLPGRSADGTEPPFLILGSHFDTKRMDSHPDPAQRDGVFLGANDGASSTGLLLELARVICSAGPRPLTYRFLFFDGEEAVNWDWIDPDNCYGSRHHAAGLKRTGQHRRVAACVVIDMVGDSDLRLDRDTNSTRELLEIFFAAARRAGLGKHVDGRSMPISDDHLPFLRVGIPSCDLIDLDFTGLDSQGRRHDYWHTVEDTPERCSPESLAIAGRIVLLGLPEVERRYGKAR